jgi:hypothetical protein
MNENVVNSCVNGSCPAERTFAKSKWEQGVHHVHRTHLRSDTLNAIMLIMMIALNQSVAAGSAIWDSDDNENGGHEYEWTLPRISAGRSEQQSWFHEFRDSDAIFVE